MEEMIQVPEGRLKIARHFSGGTQAPFFVAVPEGRPTSAARQDISQEGNDGLAPGEKTADHSARRERARLAQASWQGLPDAY